jgi:hypothetical protein
MELLLNLAWLLLALPGYWLWRRAVQSRRASSRQCFLALSCALVLLFPVISATDDLHAMRAEMEDSSVSKRAVRQTSADKHAAWLNRLQGPAALVTATIALPAPEVRLLDVSHPGESPLAPPRIFQSGRAPPSSLA